MVPKNKKKKHYGDFLGGPVAKTLNFQCRNQIPHATTKTLHRQTK